MVTFRSVNTWLSCPRYTSSGLTNVALVSPNSAVIGCADQDPEEGVLLLAYTPRPPSLATENMLRCAYRAGLAGRRLDGRWNDLSCSEGDSSTLSCKPVLLSFQFSSESMHPGTMPHDGGRTNCLSEGTWILEWKRMFPDVNFKPSSGSPSATLPFHGGTQLERREVVAPPNTSGRASPGDEMTADDLWGVL